MSQRVIDLSKKISPPLPWGNQGEAGATELFLDISEFYMADPNGKAIVTFTRQDGHTYIHKFQLENKNLFITLTATDTQLVGKCEVQINWLSQGNRLTKSYNYKSFILPAASEKPFPLTEDSVVALDNLQSYIEDAKKILEEAKLKKQIIFCDELPLEGLSEFVYLLSKDKGLYYWSDGWYLLNPKNSGGGLGDYDFVFGGDAEGPTNESQWIGGNANQIDP